MTKLTEALAKAFVKVQGKTVVIPAIYKSIGNRVFYNKKLTSVAIPDSVTSIGNSAFWYNKLTSIKIPDSITSIGSEAFRSNQLTRVAIPHGIRSIKDWTFDKNKLTSVEIPDSVTSIGRSAFGNNQLKSVEIPDNVTSIGKWAFNKNRLTNVVIPENVTSIGGGAFQYNKLTSIIIPENVTSIGDGAFQRNRLRSVVIPENATLIDDRTFQYNQLSSVVIPDGVTKVGDDAFMMNQLTSIEIPDGVTWVGDRAFGFNQLRSVVIPDSVTWIGIGAFEGNKLTSVEIPDSVTTIHSGAFSRNQLTSVVIPSSVKWIYNGAFSSNPNLKTISIAENANFNLKVFPKGVEIIRRSGNTSPTHLSVSASSFDENIASGSHIASFKTTDTDAADTFSYKFVDGVGDTDNVLFTIDNFDKLEINSSPDYETQDSYSIRVETTDSGGLTFEKSFTFTVNDLDEFPEPASIRNSTLIDNSIIIDFAKNVLPTKSGLELSIHKSSDNSLVETINFNSSTPDGLVSFETRIEDYSYNFVALKVNDITDELASEYGVKAGSQTGDYWASKLRDEWLLVIDDQSYEAKAKSELPTDATWSYHETTPEYTPGQDLSGTKQILLSPKDGIKQLIISPKASLSYDTDYYLEIENGDFKIQSTGIDLAAYKLDFDLGSSPTKSNAGTNNTESGSTQDQQQRLVFDLPSEFNNKIADKITNFNPSKETLGIDSDSFGISNSFTFKAGRNSKAVKKELAKQDFDFLYDQKKGGLYFNENGADKGFGDGGLIAILKGAPELTANNLEFA